MADRREIERLQGEIEELIADLWQVPRFVAANRVHRPQADCYRSDDPPQFTVVVELPGVDPDDVQIAASSGALVVAGQRRRPAGSGRVQQLEIDYGPFHRQLQLPAEVDTERATASLSRGLLTVVLPIAERQREGARVVIAVQTRS
jgi:HSP20 family protein